MTWRSFPSLRRNSSLGQGNGNTNPRPTVGLRVDFETASENLHALPHPEQPEPAAPGRFFKCPFDIEPDAVVNDRQFQNIVPLAQFD